MVLQELRLKNFKGIQTLRIAFNESGNVIAGPNGSGKTTIYDAFTWLLFNKDSSDRQRFSIKTLDANGEPYHNLDHSVEGVFEKDGKTVTLMRLYRELWSRRRGDAQERLTQHTTDLFINGVPATQTEFNREVEALVGDAELFKTITSVTYFLSGLHWKDRLKMLLQMAGDIGAERKILGLKMFADLAAALGGKSIEIYQRELAAKMKGIRSELESIPVRIDELNMRAPEPTRAAEEIEDEIAEAEAAIQEANEKAGNIHAQYKEARRRAKKAYDRYLALSRDATMRRAEIIRQVDGKRTEMEVELNRLIRSRDAMQRELLSAEDTAEQSRKDKLRLDGRRAELREKYSEVLAREFALEDGALNCTQCGQPLPADKVDDVLGELREAFETRKQAELAVIAEEGKKVAEGIRACEDSIESNVTRAAALKLRIEKYVEDIATLEQGVQDAPRADALLEIDEKLRRLNDEASAALKEASSAETPQTDEIKDEIAQLTARLSRLQRERAACAELESIENRIVELETQQSMLGDELARLERMQFKCEDFLLRRAKYVQDAVNAMFENVQFTLFRQQINGGIEECCEATIDGVPFNDANTAKQINAGLEVASTISKHYGVKAPVFVDHAESVLSLWPAPMQVIELRAEPGDGLTVRARNTKGDE